MRLCVRDGVRGDCTVVSVSDLHPWSLVKDVKDRLTERLRLPATRHRLFFHGRELRNTHTLNDCQITDGATIFLAQPSASSASSSASSSSSGRELISVYGDLECSAEMLDCINAVRQGLNAGLAPRLAMEGTGGTYFLRSRGKVNVAVFKAEDEEPFAPSNPRGYLGEMGAAGFRHGLLSGEGAVREVAAYLLDHDGFAAVPPTTRVELAKRAFVHELQATGNVKRLSNGLSMTANPAAFSASVSSENLHALRRTAAASSPPSSHQETDAEARKVGSLQAYVEYDEVAGDVSPHLFPAHEVHKIAILDIRLFNIDRNEANILVQRRYPQPPAAALRQSGLTLQQQLDNGGNERLSGLFSPPSIGPSHLHHTDSGFSPEHVFSFSPLVSPSHSAAGFDSPAFTSSSASQTPSLSAATPLSPDGHPSFMELPPAAAAASSISASFNLNHPVRAQTFELGGLHPSLRPTASVPIAIPSAAPSRPQSGSSLSSHGLLSSSVPNPPSRLQSRLQALKMARAQHAAVKPTYHLVPVDHSYTLPDTLELATVDWCWLDWPQAKEPLSPAVRDYVLRLDIKADIELLRSKLCIREECLKVMRISGMMLQKGVAAGLTLYDIACMMCRSNIDKPSQLEVLCAQATTLARGIRDKVQRAAPASRLMGSKKSRATGCCSPPGSALSPPSDGCDVAPQSFSPAALTESDNSSSSDSQDSPPQSADYARQPVIGSPQPSSLSRMLQLRPSEQRAADSHKPEKPMEECKVDDEDFFPSYSTRSPSFSRSAVIASVTSPPPSMPGCLSKTLPQPIPAPAVIKQQQQQSSRGGSPCLTRSNSLDLILRRSISYDDFRAVRVNKAGFSMNSITTSTGAPAAAAASALLEHSDEDDSDDDGGSQPVGLKDCTTSPPQYAAGSVYRVGGVYHHAEHEKRNAWSSEEQSRLFFSCLSGLMDSAIERFKAQQKEHNTPIPPTASSASASSGTTR